MTRDEFAICINTGESVDLQAGRVYRVVRDATADRHGLVRVFDDSGEDYLYPAVDFVEITLTPAVRERVATAFAGALAGC